MTNDAQLPLIRHGPGGGGGDEGLRRRLRVIQPVVAQRETARHEEREEEGGCEEGDEFHEPRSRSQAGPRLPRPSITLNSI